MINISIDLTKVDKKRLKDGKYLNCTVAKRQSPDKYDNDHTVYLYDKETKAKDYIGSGKEIEWKEQGNPPAPPKNEHDDLPF